MGEVFEVFEDDDQVDRFEVRDLRVKTRFAIDNAFYDEFVPVLGPTLSMIYLAFVRHANKDQKSWPSQTRIANQIGVSREWVNKQIQVLEFFNLIKKIRVGKSCTNRYYLIDEKQWRRDFDALFEETSKILTVYEKNMAKAGGQKVMSTEFTSLMSSGVHIGAIRSSHQCLVEFTSNRKDKQSKDTQKRKEKIQVKKSLSKKTSIKKKEQPRMVVEGEGSRFNEYYDRKTNEIVRRYFN